MRSGGPLPFGVMRGSGRTRWCAIVGVLAAVIAEGATPAVASGVGDRAVPTEVTAAIDDAINAALTKEKAPGVVLGLWMPGREPYVVARGVADTATDAPMRAGMVMPVGSVTKTFTATMVLQLADDEKLSLGDTLDRWYPDIPQASAITVRMLLNM